MSKKSIWDGSPPEAKNRFMVDALTLSVARSKSIDELMQNAHSIMKDNGLFIGSTGEVYSKFVSSNPYFKTLATDIFNVKVQQSENISTNKQAADQTQIITGVTNKNLYIAAGAIFIVVLVVFLIRL